MRSGRDARLRREDGAAAVEFAIVAILLFTIVFGIIQYGIFFERYNALVSSARDGARVAAVRGTLSATKTEVVAATPFTINCAVGSGSACVSVSPATDPPCSALNAGLANATVTVSYRWQPPLPFIPVPSSFTIAGVFRCE